jgi:hypothetical protein
MEEDHASDPEEEEEEEEIDEEIEEEQQPQQQEGKRSNLKLSQPEQESEDEEFHKVTSPKSKQNKSETEENIITSEEIEDLTKQVIIAKVELSILKKRKKLLLEEIHRQCLEGELDPKKRLKPYFDKRKKLKISNDPVPVVEKPGNS